MNNQIDGLKNILLIRDTLLTTTPEHGIFNTLGIETIWNTCGGKIQNCSELTQRENSCSPK